MIKDLIYSRCTTKLQTSQNGGWKAFNLNFDFYATNEKLMLHEV